MSDKFLKVCRACGNKFATSYESNEYCFPCFTAGKGKSLGRDGVSAERGASNCAATKPLLRGNEAGAPDFASEAALLKRCYEEVGYAGVVDRASMAATLFISLTKDKRMKDFRR